MLAQSSRVQLAFICQINLIQWSWIQLSCLLNVFIPISSAREDEEEGAHKHSSTANVLTRHCGEKAACSSVTNNINDGSVPLSVSFSHPSEPACTIRSQEMAHLDEMWPSLFAPLFPLWHYECLMWKGSTALWRLTGVIHVTPCRILFPWIYSVQQWLFFFFCSHATIIMSHQSVCQSTVACAHWQQEGAGATATRSAVICDGRFDGCWTTQKVSDIPACLFPLTAQNMDGASGSGKWMQ